MDSFLKHRGSVLLGVFVSLGVLSLLRIDRPDPTIGETFATNSHEELMEAAPGSLSGVFCKTAEVYFDDIDVDVVPGRAGREEPEPPPPHRILDSTEAPVPGLTPSPIAVSAVTAPASVAETAYEVFWEEFIEDMDLPDEPAVRRIITEWHRFNLELIFARQDGDITNYELAQSVLSLEYLRLRLAPYLTTSQLHDVVENFDAFSDFIAGENA